jgi:hypothetical protein
MRIDDANDDICGVDRLESFDDAELFNRFFDASTAPDAGSIDQSVSTPITLERDEHRITRSSRRIESHQSILTEEPIDQCRLTNVGPSDHRDFDAIAIIRVRIS